MDGLDPEVRRIVRDGLQQAFPDADTEARVLAGLLARLPTGPIGGGDPGGDAAIDPTVAATAGKGVVVKSIFAVVAAIAVVGGTAIAMRDDATKAATEVVGTPHLDSPRTSSPGAATLPAQSAPPAVPQTVAPAPMPATAPSSTTRADPGNDRNPDRRAIDPPSDDLAAEAELVAQAERSLSARDVEQALALAAEHARRFPHGQLAIEAEAIVVAATCDADRAGADEAAAAFLLRHAKSPAAAKVRAHCPGIANNRRGE
jgi:hypothetical protein